jgi:hypothetical protein
LHFVIVLVYDKNVKKITFTLFFFIFFAFFKITPAQADLTKTCSAGEQNPATCIISGTRDKSFYCCEGYTCVGTGNGCKGTALEFNPSVSCGICVAPTPTFMPGTPTPTPGKIAPIITCNEEDFKGDKPCAKDSDCCPSPPGLKCMVNTGASGYEDAIGNSICTLKTGDLYLPVDQAADHFKKENKFGEPPCKQMGTAPDAYFTCDTGFGFSIDTRPADFIKAMFGIILSVSGGIALLLIIISGYGMIASRGNPEKIQAARERLTAAIIGLVFIIFSIVILQIIGVDILHIPQFK